MNTSHQSNFSANLRQAYAERHAQANGTIRRSHLCAAFGISKAQASADLQALCKLQPCLQYDLSRKAYVWRGHGIHAITLPEWLTINL